MLDRISREKSTVELMIRMYCRHKEGNPTLCPICAELLRYASARLDHCRFGPCKPTCRKCLIHCYSPAPKAHIRTIMRWAGPRMILYHPIVAVRHLIWELKR